MTRASCVSYDRALGQTLTRVSLSSPFCGMDRKLVVPDSQTLQKSHFVRTPALCPTTESTPNISKHWEGGTCYSATGHSYHHNDTEVLIPLQVPGSPRYSTALRSTPTAHYGALTTITLRSSLTSQCLGKTVKTKDSLKCQCMTLALNAEAASNREMMLLTQLIEHLFCTWHCGRSRTP